MKKVLKIKDWIDKKRSVETVLNDWAKRVAADNKSVSENIQVQNLTQWVDPDTGELSITIKYDPQIGFSKIDVSI